MDEINEVAQEYHESEQRLSEVKEKLSEIRSNTFGTDSEEVEEKARSLFKEVGKQTDDGQSQQIDEYEQQVEELEQQIDELEEELQRELTEIRFPFDESINSRESEEEVAFPFVDSLPEEVIEAMGAVISNDLESDDVELRAEEIAVHTDDVNEAISKVERFAKKLREAARHELNTEDYVDQLSTRDEKIQRMLYELYESDEPLQKKDLEERSGVGKGDLRGVLYSVYQRDPYLKKEDKKYVLSEIGESVMDKFTKQYDKPEMTTTKDKAESDDTENDEENQLTLESGGNKDE